MLSTPEPDTPDHLASDHLAPDAPAAPGPGVLAIIRLQRAEPPDALLDALVTGGVRHVEVTTSTPGALRAIGRWRSLGLDVAVGAGTVMNEADARRTADAGAQFVVSPHTDAGVAAFCRAADLPFYPGAATATEVVAAWRAGAAAAKLFPADCLGGPRLVAALAAPLPYIPLLPTGGVDAASTRQYARLGCAGVGVGSSLVSEAAVRDADWSELTSRAQLFVRSWALGCEER